ncbi:putative ATP-dependent RNA helicase DDX28 [Halotydeus destructor]|nr:putative ATP-dependent RNA helicase DDX28 [Halotydeus destructor]
MMLALRTCSLCESRIVLTNAAVLSQRRTYINDYRHSLRKPAKQVPIITVPKYLEASVEKHEKRIESDIQEVYRRRSSQGNRNVPVITSVKRPQLNYYHGQGYPKTSRGKENIPLASLGWQKLKYKNDRIVFRPYANNPFFEDDVSEEHGSNTPDFASMKLTPTVLEALKKYGLKNPTRIQREGIPAILGTHNVVVSAETGSGKTIAYLAPILHSVVRQKLKQSDEKSSFSHRSPKALIVVPSRELAQQVGTVARDLGKLCNVGVATMIGGESKHLPHTGYDVVVTTIGLVAGHQKRGIYKLDQVNQIVLDEADTLLDDSFSFNVTDLLHHTRLKDDKFSGGVQLILVSATIPHGMKDILDEFVDMDNVERIATQSLHQVMPHIKQTFINVGKYDRDAMLLRLAKESVAKEQPTIIFSNRTKMSNWLYGMLKDNDVHCGRLNKSVHDMERLEVLERFNSGDLDVISATDLGSRGIDTTKARHIINYDCPRFVADYIHRAGRTGRIGSHEHCQVTTFVSFTPNFFLLQELEYSIRTRKPLDSVNANINKLYKEHRLQKFGGKNTDREEENDSD